MLKHYNLMIVIVYEISSGKAEFYTIGLDTEEIVCRIESYYNKPLSELGKTHFALVIDEPTQIKTDIHSRMMEILSENHHQSLDTQWKT